MSSILTNNGAMVALQTLRGINSAMEMTQNEISTGKSVATARDNAAVWAISKVMESDVKGFEAISDSLSLGKSTVAVARNASESITGLLTEIKGKIVASQEDNVDRAKIQTDIKALSDQIKSVVGAAQFNGLNMIARPSDTDADPVNVLSSLDRASDGTITAANISVSRQDLSQEAASVDSSGTYAAGTGSSSVTLNATQAQTITVGAPTAGTAYSIGLAGTDGDASKFTPADYTTAGTAAGAGNIAYVAKEGDTAADVAKGLAAAFAAHVGSEGLDTDVVNVTATGSTLNITSGVTDASDTVVVRLDTVTGDNVAAGGLADLANLDVSTSDGADAALKSIEGMIQTSIDAAAKFGSAQKRIEIQNDFVGKLTDSLKSGIGAMVDADMEETSARLQALQVQQQLGTQSLSIANKAPQALLSLFR